MSIPWFYPWRKSISSSNPCRAKVRFLPLSARYAVRKLRKDGARYGFTFVDAYFGRGIPDELVTVEFFKDLRPLSEHTAMNVIMDRDMESDFAMNLLDLVSGGVWQCVGEGCEAGRGRPHKRPGDQLGRGWIDALDWRRHRVSRRQKHRGSRPCADGVVRLRMQHQLKG